MSTPPSADVTGGIPNRSLKTYGNIAYEDCVIAAAYHIEQFKNVAKGSSFKKLLWRLGFHVPTNQMAIKEYGTYLASQKSPPNAGVVASTYLNWKVARGDFAAWSQVDTWSQGSEERLHQAMIDFRGVILAGDLTLNSVNTRQTWTIGTSSADEPNPNFGHAVALCHYTPQFDECVTWGYRQRMTREFRSLVFGGAFVFLLNSEKNDPGFASNLATIKSWTGVQQG